MSSTIKFNLKPRGSAHHITVRIFPTKDAMYRYNRRFCKRTGAEVTPANYIGLFKAYTRHRPTDNKMHPDIGQVLLVHGHCNHGITTHELAHAAMHFERVVHGNRNATFGTGIAEKEERFLHTLTDLVDGFHDKVTIKIPRR